MPKKILETSRVHVSAEMRSFCPIKHRDVRVYQLQASFLSQRHSFIIADDIRVAARKQTSSSGNWHGVHTLHEY